MNTVTAWSALSALLLVGCDIATEPSLFELASNRNKWSRNGPGVYQFDFHRGCFCPDESLRRVRISVDGGVVVSVLDLDTQQPVSAVDVDRYYRITIDSLFHVVWDARERADDLRVDFDPTLGYPRHIRIDYYKNGIDDELGLKAENLAPL